MEDAYTLMMDLKFYKAVTGIKLPYRFGMFDIGSPIVCFLVGKDVQFLPGLFFFAVVVSLRQKSKLYHGYPDKPEHLVEAPRWMLVR